MPDDKIVNWIREKYIAIAGDLDERGRRRWAAAEARSLGWGGITAVAQATGLSDRTIRNGLKEINDPDTLSSDRQRCPGAGRNCREDEQPRLVDALNGLIEPSTRGDPITPLRWTCKSTRVLAEELQSQGFRVSSRKVATLLKSQGYSLQANRKTVEGKQHPDRDAQFRHIGKRIKAARRGSQPAISVDTKKKESLGNSKNPGRTYRPRETPIEVETHDFPDPKLGKAVPYGVYDIEHSEAGVSIGISHDTAEFAVTAIKRWWDRMGREQYPLAKRVLIVADCGGSNSPRTRLWRWELQQLANASGLTIEVAHYPPGTSKWNQIEHRLFCHIARNWQGVPLVDLTTVVSLVNATTTNEGLEVHAWLDGREYEKARKISDQQLNEVRIKRNRFHGEWNYEIQPNLNL